MFFTKYYYEKIIKYDFINKFKFNHSLKIPKFRKIILHLKCRNFNVQKFAKVLLALELVSLQKPQISRTTTANAIFKIQKGSLYGCKVILTKKRMYKFLDKFLIEILPELKSSSDLKISLTNNCISCKFLANSVSTKELLDLYPLFYNLPVLRVIFVTTTQIKEKSTFLFKNFHPLKGNV